MKLLFPLLLLCGSAIGQRQDDEFVIHQYINKSTCEQMEKVACTRLGGLTVETVMYAPVNKPFITAKNSSPDPLEARIAALEKRVKELEERIAKDGTAQFTSTPPYRDPTQPIYVPRDLGIDPCMGSVADRPEDWACPVGGVLVEKSIEQCRCSNHKEYKCFYPQATGSRR